MSSQLFHRIYEIVLRIPKGKVATYGQIARLAGNNRAARTVGWVLHALPDESPAPWHRVINRSGRSSFPEAAKRSLQRALLEQEGVVFDENGVVDLAVFQWDGAES